MSACWYLPGELCVAGISKRSLRYLCQQTIELVSQFSNLVLTLGSVSVKQEIQGLEISANHRAGQPVFSLGTCTGICTRKTSNTKVRTWYVASIQRLNYNGQGKTRNADAQTTHIQVQNWYKRANVQKTQIQVLNYKKCVSYVSEIHTSNTKHTVLDLFNVCSNQAPLNYNGQESENSMQFMILNTCDHEIRSTLSNLVCTASPWARL